MNKPKKEPGISTFEWKLHLSISTDNLTYAEIFVLCGQSGLTSFAWRWPSCPPIIENFKRVLAFSPLFGDEKHFSFLYFKWTEVIRFDYAGYRNLYRHGAVVVFANALNLANAFVVGFLLLHNQLLIINRNQ